jgi:hypothetical protein
MPGEGRVAEPGPPMSTLDVAPDQYNPGNTEYASHVIFLDFETRSRLSLKTVSTWRYAADASTEVLCACFTIGDGPVVLWVPGAPVPPEIIAAASEPGWRIVAHNAQFEHAIINRLLSLKHGWPVIDISKFECTMAMAYASALPGSLDGAAAALGLDVRKDKAGAALMKKIASYKIPHPTVEQVERLYEYCRQDVAVEQALHRRLPPLTETEQELWCLDHRINAIGLPIDRELAAATAELAKQQRAAIDDEIAALTGGEVTTANQVARMIAVLAAEGCTVTALDKAAVKKALTGELTDKARKLLELRAAGAQAAAAKVTTLLTGLDVDDRLRETLAYHRAGTGRWAGRRFQPQNLRKVSKTLDADAAIAAIKSGDLKRVATFGPPLSIAAEVSRGLIRARPRYVLLGADFSAIESRVLAWLSGESWKLDSYRKFDETGDPRLEVYCQIASKILGRTVTPDDEEGRGVGKVADLSGGYGGGVGAWRRFAPKDTRGDAEIKIDIDAYRKSHPNTVRFWHELEKALKRVIRKPGVRFTYGRISAECRDGTLHMILPSGRAISYPEARLVPGKFEGTVNIQFKDNGSAKKGFRIPAGQTAKWHDVVEWYGTFTENCVQAVARDVLAAALVRVDAAGFTIVGHVHDEVIVELPEGEDRTEEFLAVLTTAPDWADGLPLAAKVWTGQRFLKSSKAAPVDVDEDDIDEQELPVVPEVEEIPLQPGAAAPSEDFASSPDEEEDKSDADDAAEAPGASPTETRLAMWRNGYSPLPLVGKNPDINGKGWQKKRQKTTEAQIRRWERTYPKAVNTGYLCRTTPTLDIDIPDQEAADAARAYMEKLLGDAMLCRVGNAPKFAIPYRTDTPFGKIRVDLIPPGGLQKGSKPPAIEFLCDGQQVVAFGRHPDTGRDYEWLGGGSPMMVRREDLPSIDEEGAHALVDELVDALVCELGFEVKNRSASHAPSGNDADHSQPDNPFLAFAIGALNGGSAAPDADADDNELADVKAALPFISNDSRDNWFAVGAALHSTGWDCARELWDEWSSSSPKFDRVDQRKTWKSYDREYSKNKKTIAGLFSLARNEGWQPAVRSPEPEPVKLNGAADPVKPNGAKPHVIEPIVIEPVDLWGQFDPPELPLGALPKVIEDFALEEGKLMGADPCGLAMAALAVCAAALPDYMQIQVKKYDPNWLEEARAWVGLIGNPSTKKSPIMRRASKAFNRLDAILHRQYLDELSLYEALPKEEQKTTPKPVRKQLRLEDVTIEAAQEVFKGNDEGVLCFQDELAGWFGSMDKYNGRGGGNKDRGFWLQTFNGGTYSLNRVGRGSSLLNNLSMSLLGGIQPDAIRAVATEAVDDGLLQRLTPIMLHSGNVGKDAPTSAAGQRYDELIEELRNRPPPGQPFQFSEEARAVREALEKKHLDLMACEVLNKKLAAHIGKYDGMFARWCLLWHCVEGRSGFVIAEDTARRVADFMHYFLLPHAAAFYTNVLDLSDDHDRLTAVAGYILAKKLERICNRDVAAGVRSMRGLGRQDTESIFQQLEALGWLIQQPDPKPGRPPHWRVNAEVHQRFEERAGREVVERKRRQEAIKEMAGRRRGRN